MSDLSDDEIELLQYSCTCLVTTNVHLPECDLWFSWDYEMGWADWDPEAQRLFMLPDDKKDDELDPITGVTVSTSKPLPPLIPKCRHYQQPVTMPDGTIIYASSHYWDRKDDPIPALGIYLDGCWTPDTIAYLVGCPDYGTPVPSLANVLHIASEGLTVAFDHLVEVGCIGGHGRTGLMLGIMAIIASHDTDTPLDGDQAIDFIRTTYCDKAIESAEQEWYLRLVSAEMRGEAHPPKPIKPPSKHFTYTSKLATVTPLPAKTPVASPSDLVRSAYQRLNDKGGK